MNLLVFDTSTDIMHVSLSRDEALKDSRVVKTTEQSYNSAFLVSTIAEILSQNNLKMSEINAIGVNIGPGSFTGLRASVTVARVIAQQLNIPAVGVPSMQVYSMLNNTDKNTLCVMDARRGMAFVGVYDKNAEPVVEPEMIEYERAINMAQQEEYFVICDSRMEKNLDNCINFETTGANYGEFLLKLTQQSLNSKKNHSWSELKPLYIQTPPVTVAKK